MEPNEAHSLEKVSGPSNESVSLNLKMPAASVEALWSLTRQLLDMDFEMGLKLDPALREGLGEVEDACLSYIHSVWVDCDDNQSGEYEWEDVCSMCMGTGMSFAGADNGCPSCCTGCYHCGSEDCKDYSCLEFD